MPDTIGFIDGIDGRYVRGWAVAANGRPATIVIRDPAGKVLARGQASLDRADVERLGFGATASGFRIPVRRLGKVNALHVLADGTELTGSPIALGAGLFDGAVSIADGVASGWVMERADGFRGAPVRLHDQDGTLLGEAEAVIEASPEDPFEAPARFSIVLDQVAFGRADLIVRASVNGTGFAATVCSMRLDGYCDALTERRCSGWLMSPDAPGRTLEIEVFRDGALVGSGRCDYPREDVRHRYAHGIRVGFEITLAAPPLRSRSAPVYSVRLAGTDIELFDGPMLIEDRTDAVAAARRLGTLAQSAAMPHADRVVLRRALGAYIGQRRHGERAARVRVPTSAARGNTRLAIVIPIYRGVEITAACIASVLGARDASRDRVMLVNDASPEPGMAELLEVLGRAPGVSVLANAENRGFVGSANRGIAACRQGDVLLLNSDTLVFPGMLDELARIARSSPDIGTVTPLSNNATIFSYPHPSLPPATLADMEWGELAALALAANAGMAIDVPTGHGFCLLIRRPALELVGQFDEGFGRGYGEENDFCQRVADLGFRNVAAAGAFVEHRESISFGPDKQALVEANLARLGRMYPDYAASITAFESRDDLRRARWPVDAARLRKAGAKGTGFTLIVSNWLGGGARKAVADFEATVGYGGDETLTLSCRDDGMIELTAENPVLRAGFASDETASLFDLLSGARVNRVLVHQVLGFSPEFMKGLAGFVAGRPSIFYAHDFYSICPRVTLIDAAGAFCDIAEPETCRRCVKASGAHEASRLDALTPAEHRARMGKLLAACRHVVAPSDDAASYLRRVWPTLPVQAVPHPEPTSGFAAASRGGGNTTDVVLLGGIGPHKGSVALLALARRALLSHPELRFQVIGHTDIDVALREVGNVVMTGSYEPSELPSLLARTDARLALFLHQWPETWSYTLSEAVTHGLYPLVPDIGAPAERVRRAGWGVVFGFPIDPVDVLAAITAAWKRSEEQEDSARMAAFVREDAVARHRALLNPERDDRFEEPGRVERQSGVERPSSFEVSADSTLPPVPIVIPAKAGIHPRRPIAELSLNSRVRGNDN